MTVITLSEQEARSYAELGWPIDSPVLAQLEQFNEAAGTEFVRVGLCTCARPSTRACCA